MKVIQHEQTGLIVPEDTNLPVHKDPERDWVVDAGFVIYEVDPKNWRVLEIPDPAKVRRPHDMSLSEQVAWRRYALRYGPMAAATALPRTKVGFELMHRCFHLLCPPVTPLRELRRFTELTGLELEQDHFTSHMTGTWVLDRFKFVSKAVLTHPAVQTAEHIYALLVREYGEEAAQLAELLFDYEPNPYRVLRRGMPKVRLQAQLLASLRGEKPVKLDREKLVGDMMNLYGQAFEFLEPDTFATLLSKAGGR